MNLEEKSKLVVMNIKTTIKEDRKLTFFLLFLYHKKLYNVTWVGLTWLKEGGQTLTDRASGMKE